MGAPCCNFDRYEVNVVKQSGTLVFDFASSETEKGYVPDIKISFIGGVEFSIRAELNNVDEVRNIGYHFMQLANRLDHMNDERNEYEE